MKSVLSTVHVNNSRKQFETFENSCGPCALLNIRQFTLYPQSIVLPDSQSAVGTHIRYGELSPYRLTSQALKVLSPNVIAVQTK